MTSTNEVLTTYSRPYPFTYGKIKIEYFIALPFPNILTKLTEAINRFFPGYLNYSEIDYEVAEERRSLIEIQKAEEEFFDRIWYDRKLVMLNRIKQGLEKHPPADIKKKMFAAMKRIEAKYGEK